MAAAGAARADREVGADQLAAMVGENRRAFNQACALLLAAAGGESSDAAAVWLHAAEDRGAAVGKGIGVYESSRKNAIFGCFTPTRGRTCRCGRVESPLDSKPNSSFAFANSMVLVRVGSR